MKTLKQAILRGLALCLLACWASAAQPESIQTQELRTRLELLEKAHARALERIAVLEGHVKELREMLGAQTPKGPSADSPIPLLGDETSVLHIGTDRHAFLGKTVTLFGGLSLQHYYNYGYGDAERSHFSLAFQEMTASWDLVVTGPTVDLYLRRSIGSPLIDAIRQSVGQGHAGKLARIQVVMFPSRFDESGPAQLEIVNWQFLNEDRTGWQPWAIPPAEAPGLKGSMPGTVPRPAKR